MNTAVKLNVTKEVTVTFRAFGYSGKATGEAGKLSTVRVEIGCQDHSLAWWAGEKCAAFVRAEFRQQSTHRRAVRNSMYKSVWITEEEFAPQVEQEVKRRKVRNRYNARAQQRILQARPALLQQITEAFG